MQYCPHCMTATEEPFCPVCHNPTSYTPQAGQLAPGTTPDGRGRYLLGAALGAGGFGITYIGLDQKTGKRVAVKEYFPIQCAFRAENGAVMPKPGMEDFYAGGRKSFLTEGQMLYGQRAIPSVVQVHDYFEANNTAYLVMEYLEGITLQQKLQRDGVVDFETLQPKLYTLISDLSKLHKAGVLHRDISPDNVMWMPDGSLKLLDFGAARSMEDGKSMTVQLKHGFAPVEQYQTHGQGPWTDVYALSATIYYSITGHVPPMAPERLETDTLVPPSQLGAKLTSSQEEALLWGLTVQPKSRPVNMEVFGEKLFEGMNKVVVYVRCLPQGALLNDRYLIESVLDDDNFYITYRATEKNTQLAVIIQEYFPTGHSLRVGNSITPPIISPDPGQENFYDDARKRILAESKALYEQSAVASLVQVRDYFEANNTAYRVMEQLDGETLFQKVKREGAISFETLEPKLHALVYDLGKLHAGGSMCFNINPESVLWTSDGTLKLLDFGVKDSIEREYRENNTPTAIIYHSYFAPAEQYQTRNQGPWTDVYALSATIYYCITGKAPSTVPERLAKDDLQPPAACGAHLTAQQEEALLWGLEVQPKKRPQSMEAFGEKLFRTPDKTIQLHGSGTGKTSATPLQRKFLIGCGVALAVAVFMLILIAIFH